jgi:ABC-type phosphate transport system substrate-binding protein
MRYSCLAAGLAAAVGALSAASGAQAQTCAFTGTTIYAAGSTAQQPYVAVLSQIFAAQTPPVNLVYQGIASCAGVEAITTSTAQTSSITSWTAPAAAGAAPTAATCTPSTPVTIDVGVSDVYASTCVGATVPAGQEEFFGPIQAMTMVVNPNSTQSAISEEAAHVVFKDLGVTSFTVSPWTSATDIWIRPGGENGSGTRFMIANALGMLDTDWSTSLTNDTGGSSSVLSGVSGDSAHANASLGILSVTNTDFNRPSNASSTTQVKELAFQAKGQSCGYLPDSSATTFDKLNVREGRYVIWGPGHYITAVTGGVPMSSSAPGTAADAAVQYLIKLVTFDKSLSDADAMTSIQAAATTPGLIPDCAMRVQRVGEVTANPIEYSYLPPEGSCGCYWESQTGTTACTTCTTSTTCPSASPVCRYGYCEAF